MPSDALNDFEDRLKQVQQLVDAHGALVRLKRAQRAMEESGGGLAQIKGVIDALVSDPSAGRPPEVQALNSAAVALLSAHLQGFVTDLYNEAARHLIASHVPDIEALIQSAPVRGNPNEQNITKLFQTIGFTDVLHSVSWRRMGNSALRKKLREFNELRNRIVHGKREAVHKSQVENYMAVWANFAKHLDRVVGSKIQQTTGHSAW